MELSDRYKVYMVEGLQNTQEYMRSQNDKRNKRNYN